MSIRITAISTILAGSMLAAGALAQQWTGSSSPEDLRYRLDILDAELADIRARLGGSVGSVVRQPSSGGGGGGAVSDNRVIQLESEIRRLTASIEQLQNRVERIASDATRRFGDIEFRLNELEGNPGGGSVGQLGGPAQNLNTNTNVAATSVAEQGALDRAAKDVQQGRFDQAEDRLRRFLNDYRGSPLTGQAYYWLGESQSVRGQDAEAARSFLNGYNFDRRGPEAPANLLRLGMTLGRLGQLNEACLTLREVRTQFPNSAEVQKADAEARQLSCG